MRTVYVAPVGEVEAAVVDVVALALGSTFGLPVARFPQLPDPVAAFDAARQQYSSSAILRDMRFHCPRDPVNFVGITERDLFIPMLSFVFGQAQVGGPLALVSCARLRQEFYGLPPNPALLYSRAAKEGIHEIGHTLGMVHCPDAACPMALSNTIVQVDRKRDTLCESCAALVHEATGKEIL
jgi:archaemetzincin